MTIIKLRPGKLPESRFWSKANFARHLLLFQYPIYEGKQPHGD